MADVHEKRETPSLDATSTEESHKAAGVDVKHVNTTDTVPSMGEEKMTKAKWLAAIALGLAYTTTFQQLSCTGAIIKSIDEAIGPTNYFNWMVTANTITTSMSLPLAGGLSDTFGRRWFLIIGNLFSLLGAIVALVAPNIPTIIASMAITGFGAGAQQLALAAVAELVPNKHRGIVAACLDLVVFPWSVFGGLAGGAMVTYHGKYGFRINFMIGIALNAISVLMAYFYYHPPANTLKRGGRSKRQVVWDLDWFGIFLMTISIILILLGISLGGVTYPWKHAGIIAPLTIGVVALIVLGFWEAYGAKNPFMARELFVGKARTFGMFLVVDFVAGMGLYAAAVFFAQMVRGMWNGDPIKVGILAIPAGVGGAFGGFAAGMLIGKYKIFSTRMTLLYGTIIKVLADGLMSLVQPSGPYSIPFALGMSFLSQVGTGWISVSLIVCVQLSCEDEDIGLATLILGSIRSIGGSVAVTIYSNLLTTKLLHDAPARVAAAVMPKGFRLSLMKPLLEALINENIEGAKAIPGVTPTILQAARDALNISFSKGFRLIYITAAAFGAAGAIAAILTRDVSHNMTNSVAVRLDNEKTKVDSADSMS